MKKLLSDAFQNKFYRYAPSSFFQHKSWSQSGEDSIVTFVLSVLGKKSGFRYLDLGAHHPFYLSNTAVFYFKKGSGVLVEPDPELAINLKKKRPRDLILNMGVRVDGVNDDILDFYIMDARTLNTFSKSEASRYQDFGHKIVEIKKVPVIDTCTILNQYFADGIDLLSIDVEGLDFQIIQSIDFLLYRPTVVIVESAEYGVTGMQNKDERIQAYMENNGYFVYADTFINTIFVEKKLWLSRA